MPNWKSPLLLRAARVLFVLVAGKTTLITPASAAPPQGKSAAVSMAAASSTNQQVFEARGVIQELKPDGKTVRIKHEDIPGYMPAMTMDFEAKDTNNLTGLRAGDAVTFQLVVTPRKAGLTTSSRPASCRSAAATSRPRVRSSSSRTASR